MMVEARPLEESTQPGSRPDQAGANNYHDHHDDRDDHDHLQDDNHNHDDYCVAIEITEFHLWPLLQML